MNEKTGAKESGDERELHCTKKKSDDDQLKKIKKKKTSCFESKRIDNIDKQNKYELKKIFTKPHLKSNLDDVNNLHHLSRFI